MKKALIRQRLQQFNIEGKDIKCLPQNYSFKYLNKTEYAILENFLCINPLFKFASLEIGNPHTDFMSLNLLSSQLCRTYCNMLEQHYIGDLISSTNIRNLAKEIIDILNLNHEMANLIDNYGLKFLACRIENRRSFKQNMKSF